MSARRIVLALLLAGCANATQGARRLTYPQGFQFMTGEQIRGVMWKFAEEVRVLDELLKRAPPPRDAVVASLRRMEAQAAVLGGPSQASNHPRIDSNLPRFQRDLQSARLAAEADPPNYYFTGSVVGACLYCHDSR